MFRYGPCLFLYLRPQWRRRKSQVGEPREILLHYLRHELDGLSGFFGVEYCARYVHLPSESVSLGPQVWSEGVHIPSGPEDIQYDSIQRRNVSLGIQFRQ